MFSRSTALLLVFLAVAANAQHVTAPHASVVEVATRQVDLQATTDPLLREAISKLSSCVSTPLVAAPTGRMDIPHHHLNGSHGILN